MRHALALAPIATLWLISAGCVQVMTGRYAINGQDVGSLGTLPMAGVAVNIGANDAATARRKLGAPIFHCERGDNGEIAATDLFEARPRYRWVFNPWPVVLVNQKSPGNPRVLARIDYDAHGTVRRVDTTPTPGPSARGLVPIAAKRAWPDLAYCPGG